MAIPAQGMTFTWGGQTLSEVREFDVNLARGLPLGRVTTWTPNNGEIRLIGFSYANLPFTEYGKRKKLEIIGRASTVFNAPPVTLFSGDCIYRDTQVQGVVNDAIRFAFVFSVQDTTDAPSNP